jgi:hypothetical protein
MVFIPGRRMAYNASEIESFTVEAFSSAAGVD